MLIGVPREIKTDEYRVAMLPVGAQILAEDGHRVLMEKGAGLGSGFDDTYYVAAGAELVESADEFFAQADLIIKVKEPQPQEITKLRKGQVVFCYFHFAPARELIEGCLQAGITAVAYERNCWENVHSRRCRVSRKSYDGTGRFAGWSAGCGAG